MKKQRILQVTQPSFGDGKLVVTVGMGKSIKDKETFKPRFKFWFESKENLDDFITTLIEYSKIAFSDKKF